jgi:hypothetical protein
LTIIEVEDGNINYCVEDNVLYNKTKTVLLQYPCGSAASFFTIPNSVTRIADYAFDNSDNLVEVSIPNSVEEIGTWAFHQCNNLATMFIPASVREIREGAFTGTNNLTSIAVALDNPAYTSIDGVIYSKDLSTVVAYPVNNSRNNYAILNGTESVFGYSFSDSKQLSSITIPNTITTIGSCAFFGCSNLVVVDFPTSITNIEGQAFDYCTNLVKAYFHSLTPPTVKRSIFGGNEDLTIYVPYQSLKAYMANPNLYRAHIDPALDWHDNHWSWVFCCVEGIDFSLTEGLTAYKVVKSVKSSAKTRTSSGSSVEFVEIDKAGPGDCVLLVGEPGKTYELHTDADAPNLTDNLLTGSVDGENVSSTDGDMTNYVFNGEEFVQVSSSEGVEAGTGFLQIPTSEVAEIGTTISVTEALDLPSDNDVEEISISDFGKSTYCSTNDLDFSKFGDNLKAYVATGYDPNSKTIWMTRVYNVPAGTGIFLKGEKGTYNIPVKASTSYYKNMMVGTLESTDIPSSTDEYTNLYLAKDGDVLKFCTIAGTGRTMGANKAYLQIPKTFTERPMMASATSESITLTEGKSTYCSSNDLDFSTMGDALKAYAATGYTNGTGTIWMTRVYDVPAGMGIFLKGENKTHSVPTKIKSSTSQYESCLENMLVGTLTKTYIQSSTDTYKNMYLTKENGVLKFCGIAGDGRDMSANKAYLQIPLSALSKTRGTESGEMPSYTLDFNDDVIGIPVLFELGSETGIMEANSEAKMANDIWYNLNGQRVENPGKGLYIRNGKKIIIR